MFTGGSFWAILVLFYADNLVNGEITKEDLIQRNITGTSIFLPEDYKDLENFKPIDLKTVRDLKLPDDPLLVAKRFEGDIANLTAGTIHKFINASNSWARAAIKEKWRLWPKKEIPYLIERSYTPLGRKIILMAIEEYHKNTCIRFVPRTTQSDYIHIKPDDGCYSLVGRTGGMQIVSLDEACMMVGTVIHELMHSTGFFHEQSVSVQTAKIHQHCFGLSQSNIQMMAHNLFFFQIIRLGSRGFSTLIFIASGTVTENSRVFISGQHESYAIFILQQSRTDRDENVKIVWKNIEPDAEDQFEKYGLNTITLLDLPYDYGSVMHYGPKAFSKNDKDTIVPLKSAESSKMGQREGFSSLDVQKLRKLYACDDSNGFGAVVTKSPASKPFGTTTDRCKDRRIVCIVWKTFGYCETDKERMLEVCPRSCNLCDQLPHGGMPPSANDDDDVFPSPTTEEPCSDTNGHCQTWADQGYCKRQGYAAFVLQKCPKACGSCGRPTADIKARDVLPECRDSSEKCLSYAAMDMCIEGRNREFIRANCKRSCGLCQQS